MRCVPEMIVPEVLVMDVQDCEGDAAIVLEVGGAQQNTFLSLYRTFAC